MALEYERRPLIGQQNASPCFHLRKKKNAHIKVKFMYSGIFFHFIGHFLKVSLLLLLFYCFHSLRHVNDVNGGDNVFIGLSVFRFCSCVCASAPGGVTS